MLNNNYIKIAYRNILRNKVFSLINLVGLAIGIAISIILMTSVKFELSIDRFHQNKDQIYRLLQVGDWNGEIVGNNVVPYMLAPTLEEKYPEIKEIMRFRYYGYNLLKIDDAVYKDFALLAEPTIFSMFSFTLLQGDINTVFEDENSIVLSESVAKKYFDEINPLGKQILFNNSTLLTVTGIVEDCPENSSLRYSVILPFKALGKERISSWSWESSAYVRIEKGTNISDFTKKIENIISEYQANNVLQVRLQSLLRESLYDTLEKPTNIIYVLIELSIALFILLLAIINFVNLTTAHSAKRAKEIGIRKVVGAKKSSLVSQFLLESIFLSLISLFFALILIEIFQPIFNEILQKSFSFNVFDPLNFILIIVFSVIVGVIAGLYPAFYLSNLKIINILKNTPLNNHKNTFRAILVIIQFSISIILLICTFTVYSQFKYLINKPLGYNQHHIIHLQNNVQLEKNYDEFKNDLLKNTNIINVSQASGYPANIGNVNPPKWDGKKDESWILFNFINVDRDFIDVFGLELINGKNFDKDFVNKGDAQYILNEKALDVMGYDSYSSEVIGKRFTMWDDSVAGEIIGVIKDFHFQPLSNEINPLMISNITYWGTNYIFIRLREENVTDVIDYIKAVYDKFSSDYPMIYSFLDEDINENYQYVKTTSFSVLLASWVAIFISLLGLTGLTMFMIELRTKEIGIRKVMGASSSSIIFLLSKDFLKYVLLANVIAWPLAWYFMHLYLENFAYKINQNILLYLISTLIAIILSLIVVIILAYKVSKEKPSNSLKYE